MEMRNHTVELFQKLFSNYILIAALSGWLVAQIIKAILHLVVTGEFQIERLFGDGGMPSCHSATVCALATATGLGCGVDSSHFALAFVFAFFQLKCLSYFVKEENYSSSLICVILTCLFLWNNIYNINGARFWTASWISIYCVFKIFHDQKLFYFLLALCLPMIHASYLVFPIILLLALFLQKYRNSLIILFCFSWFFSIIATDFNVQLPAWVELPFAISKKIDFYSSEEYINSLGKGTGFYWVSLFFKTVSRHFIEILILLISLHDKNVQNPKNLSIVRFMLILAIIANFGMIVPTFGGRFFVVNYALVAYSFLVTFGDSKYKELIYLLPFVWFMNIFYLYKDVTAVLDFGFVLPPIISFFRYLFI